MRPGTILHDAVDFVKEQNRVVRLSFLERSLDVLFRLAHPTGQQVAPHLDNHAAVQRLPKMLHELCLAGSGRPPQENVHARAVRIVPILLTVPEIPHSLHNPVERDIPFDVQSVQGVVLRRHERVVLRLRLHEFAMGFHERLDERGYLVLARTHALDVLQNHRYAARAGLVLLSELFGELCGDEPFKPELLHTVAPDGRTLTCAELVETDRVVETTPDGIIQRPCRGIRYPYCRQFCLVENRVDHAFFGTRRHHATEQRRKEVHARAEKLVGFVDHYHAPLAWHLIVADPNPGHPALR